MLYRQMKTHGHLHTLYNYWVSQMSNYLSDDDDKYCAIVEKRDSVFIYPL